MSNEHCQFVLRFLETNKGDSLERAEDALRLATGRGEDDAALQAMVAGYRAGREKFDAAVAWLASLPAEPSAHYSSTALTEEVARLRNILRAVNIKIVHCETLEGGCWCPEGKPGTCDWCDTITVAKDLIQGGLNK